MNQILQIDPRDNVAIALQPLAQGTEISIGEHHFTLTEDIPTGHKIALTYLPSGVNVFRYGYPIGHTVVPVHPGQWLHSHNLETNLRGKVQYQYQPEPLLPRNISSAKPIFKGFCRPNGSVGIRNEIWIINTVGCINKLSDRLAAIANERYRDLIHQRKVDGIYAFSHPYGCSQLGDDLVNTQKILAGLVQHPNAAGVLVVGLGCENNQIENFQKLLADQPLERVKYLNMQTVEDELEAGLTLLAELIEYATQFQQTSVPVSELKVGLKCGGSDGLSGITANPLVGQVTDTIISYGGTAVLSEVPEMFGAETILMNRAKDQETFTKTVALINNFKDYFAQHEQPVYLNPSPGNKSGGITTLEEKSLGCVQKGGTAPVVDVLQYGASVNQSGLNLLEAPGNDLVSCTALAAAGAQLILFTTGRGNPMGAIVPTIKIATNSELANYKPNWIDFNAGALLEGVSMSELAEQLFQLTLTVAGQEQQTKNEQNDYRDIAIFKSGVTL